MSDLEGGQTLKHGLLRGKSYADLNNKKKHKCKVQPMVVKFRKLQLSQHCLQKCLFHKRIVSLSTHDTKQFIFRFHKIKHDTSAINEKICVG